MPGNIGWQGIVIILLVLLLMFGPKRLPEMGRSIGHGMREFKDSLTGKSTTTSPSASRRRARLHRHVRGPPAAARRPSGVSEQQELGTSDAPACRVASSTASASRSSSTSTSFARA